MDCRARRTRPLAGRPARRARCGCQLDGAPGHSGPLPGLGARARGSRPRRIWRRSHGRGTPTPISPSPAPVVRLSWSGCERSSTTSRSACPTPDHWSPLSSVLAKRSTRASKGRRIPISGLPQLPLSRPSRSPIERATRGCARQKRRSSSAATGRGRRVLWPRHGNRAATWSAAPSSRDREARSRAGISFESADAPEAATEGGARLPRVRVHPDALLGGPGMRPVADTT